MKCDNCLRDECGVCVNCLDKPKNGGMGKIKQKCIERRCKDVPSTCEYCDFEAANSGNLYKHYSTKHGK